MRRGVMLVELLVVLVLLGFITGISTLAIGRLRTSGPADNSEDARLSGARAQAIRTGLPVSIERDSTGPVLLLPDGRAVGNGIDPLTGARADAP